jgi:hypothetical protein
MRNLSRKSLMSLCCLAPFVQSASPLQAQQTPAAAPAAADSGLPELVGRLSQIGERLVRTNSPEMIAAYNLEQADVIAQILPKSNPEDRPNWIRQLADCLFAAASAEPDKQDSALSRLKRLQAGLDQSQPGSALTAYVTLQTFEAEYLTALNAQGADSEKVQVEWCQRLNQFVQTYPGSDATPRALHEMALTSEALNKHENARRACQYLVEHFPADPLAIEAKRMLHWLDVDGKMLHLALPLLLTEDERFDSVFDVASLRGKLVIVYFWSSKTPNWRETFAALKKTDALYHDRGVELLCVNMDETPKAAREQLRDADAPGVQVFQRKGVDGYIGQRLGLPELPAVLLLGKDGRVIERVAGLGQLAVHVSKQLESDPALLRVSNPSK